MNRRGRAALLARAPTREDHRRVHELRPPAEAIMLANILARSPNPMAPVDRLEPRHTREKAGLVGRESEVDGRRRVGSGFDILTK